MTRAAFVVVVALVACGGAPPRDPRARNDPWEGPGPGVVIDAVERLRVSEHADRRERGIDLAGRERGELRDERLVG